MIQGKYHITREINYSFIITQLRVAVEALDWVLATDNKWKYTTSLFRQFLVVMNNLEKELNVSTLVLFLNLIITTKNCLK